MAKKRITGARIRDFKGITALDIDFTKGDATIITGENMQAKTSCKDAVQAGLTGQLRVGLKQRGIGPEVIRQGADRSTIFIDIDELTVCRTIGPNKTTVSVMKKGGSTKDDVIASKQQFLTDLVGAGAIDPLDLYLSPPKDRRAKILEALPLTITLDQLRKYAPDLPDTYDVSGHGLEVFDRTRQHYYDARTEANRAVKEAKKARDEADKLTKNAAPEGESVDDDLKRVEAALQAAKNAVSALDVRATEAKAAEERSAVTRARIEELRARADERAAAFEAPATFEAAHQSAIARWEEAKKERDAADAHVVELERLLAAAREMAAVRQEAADEANIAQDNFRRRVEQWENAQRAADDLRRQATELQSAVGAAVSPPTDEDRAAAARKVSDTEVILAGFKTAAQHIETSRLARAKAADAARALAAAEVEASTLDGIVKAFDKAPDELFATKDMIRGLTLEGEEVLLDGKRMDHLCGEEQLDLAVEIAKRATKCKFLIIDGLERIAPKRIDAFLSRATSGGWQVICTRVADGDLVFDYYTNDDEDAASVVAAAQIAGVAS